MYLKFQILILSTWNLPTHLRCLPTLVEKVKELEISFSKFFLSPVS